MIIPCYSDSSPSFFYEKGYQVFIDNNLEQDPLVKWKSAYTLENKTFIFWKSYTRYIRSTCLKSIFWSIYTVENGYSKDMLDIYKDSNGVFFSYLITVYRLYSFNRNWVLIIFFGGKYCLFLPLSSRAESIICRYEKRVIRWQFYF